MQHTKEHRAAVIWASNGNDHAYWRYSVASFRARLRSSCDFFVLADPKDDLHGVDRIYGLTRIDPMPYMERLGFKTEDYTRARKSWPFVIFYKLAIPLIDTFRKYDHVLFLDTDTMAMPASATEHSPDELFDLPLGDHEIAGVPDLYEPHDRTGTVIREYVPHSIRQEMEERVWSKAGHGSQAYVSAGLLLWNLDKIDIPWYAKRCAAFWSNVSDYKYPEQDFINGYMLVESRFHSTYSARAAGNGPYIVGTSCIRHFTGDKSLMYVLGGQIEEITPAARIDHACLSPRKTDLVVGDTHGICRKCVVWGCSGHPTDLKMLISAVDTLKKTCQEATDGLDMFVVTDGPWLGHNLARTDLTVIDLRDLYDRSGLRAVCNWRSWHIGWDLVRLARLFLPYIEQLSGYDLALYLDGDVHVTDMRMLDVFSEDVTGYDCAMVPEFSGIDGVYLPRDYKLRFCTAFLNTVQDASDRNAVHNRLSHGLYFNSSVFLANLRELRKTCGSFRRFFQHAVTCVGNGAPSVESDLLNILALIKPIMSAYNPLLATNQTTDPIYCNRIATTHIAGDPVYCIHGYPTDNERNRFL